MLSYCGFLVTLESSIDWTSSIIFLTLCCSNVWTRALAKNTSWCHFLSIASLSFLFLVRRRITMYRTTITAPVERKRKNLMGPRKDEGGRMAASARKTDARPRIPLVKEEVRSMLLELAIAESSFDSKNSLLSNCAGSPGEFGF